MGCCAHGRGLHDEVEKRRTAELVVTTADVFDHRRRHVSDYSPRRLKKSQQRPDATREIIAPVPDGAALGGVTMPDADAHVPATTARPLPAAGDPDLQRLSRSRG